MSAPATVALGLLALLERWQAARRELASANARVAELQWLPLEGTRHSDAARRLLVAENAEADARWAVERWLDDLNAAFCT